MTQQLFATEHVDWHAVWICHEADPHQTNMFVHFRNAFSVERLPEQATIHITADTAYKLWINGEEVGRGPAFSDPRWQSYDSHDVSNFLQAGTNVIAVLSYYYGQGVGEDVQTVNRPRPAGRMKRTVHDAMPGLLCQLEMSTGDERTCAVSDTSWKSLISKCWFADVAKIDDSTYSELYFAEREPGNWTAPDFDDTSWAGVTMRTGFIGDMYTGVDRVHAHVFPWCVLEPRQVPQHARLVKQRAEAVLAGLGTTLRFGLRERRRLELRVRRPRRLRAAVPAPVERSHGGLAPRRDELRSQ